MQLKTLSTLFGKLIDSGGGGKPSLQLNIPFRVSEPISYIMYRLVSTCHGLFVAAAQSSATHLINESQKSKGKSASH